MESIENQMLAYYAQPGPFTDPQEFTSLVQGLPSDLAHLRDLVQGLTVHIFWAKRYGLELSEPRQAEVQIRPVAKKLAALLALDPSPLTTPRPLEQRVVANCRDISVLLCSLLRSLGIPSRARCGFGTYFMPNHYEDHWVCEAWNASEHRWVMVDAQLDELQRQVLGIRFDPLDLPPGQFVLAGQAWQLCRQGAADPDQFGIFEYHGMDFICGNLFRDLLALNKIEILPWDCWEGMGGPVAEASPAELAVLDRAAELTLADNDAFPQVRAFYDQTPSFHIPEAWLA